MVVIVCWICNQPFVHSARGRRPDACLECREQFTKKEYEKFRNHHRPSQQTISFDEMDEDVLGDIGLDIKEDKDEEAEDYNVAQYGDYEESVNIDKKDSSVYQQHLNQHGEVKKSHYSQFFKDSQNKSPAIHSKITQQVAYGKRGSYPDYSEYEESITWRPWIHRYDRANLHTPIHNIRAKHWSQHGWNIQSWIRPDDSGCNYQTHIYLKIYVNHQVTPYQLVIFGH